MNLLQISFIAAVFLPRAGLAGPETYYRWVDENGTVHYSTVKPDEGAADKVVVATPPPGAGTSTALSSDSEQEQDPLAADRELWRKTECPRARESLKTMQSQNKIYTENENGERTFVPDKERSTRIREYRDFIRENCQNQ